MKTIKILITILLLNQYVVSSINAKNPEKVESQIIKDEMIIKGKDVKLVLPRGGNKNRALEFLLQKESWIRSKLSNITKPCNDIQEKMKLHNKLPILGVKHDIKYVNCENELSVKQNKKTIIFNSAKYLYSKVLTQYLKQYGLE